MKKSAVATKEFSEDKVPEEFTSQEEVDCTSLSGSGKPLGSKIFSQNNELEKELPKAIAGEESRPLKINDIEIPCYVLDNEDRVIIQKGLRTGIGMSTKGGSGGSPRLIRLISNLRDQGFTSDKVVKTISSPIRFQLPNGGYAQGYPVSILADVCEAVIDAYEQEKLAFQQEHIAERCKILLRGFARVGLIAMVDEATGYEEIRAQRALATILEQYLAEELQPWVKTFPYEFYKHIYRLKDWGAPNKNKRPAVIGRYTNNIVYERLAPGVLEELRRRNPVIPETGRRGHTHHQEFDPETGHPRLKEHLEGVMALMRVSSDWNSFMTKLDISYPKFGKMRPLINLDPDNEEFRV